MTFVWLFYDNIMKTLATHLAQQFYTYRQIQNHAVLTISLKKFIDHFLDETISKGQIFILDSGERLKTDVSYTHTQAQK
jgi:hypothetical protein